MKIKPSIEKSYFPFKHIFKPGAMLRNKIVAFGARKKHISLRRSHHIQNMWQFDAVFVIETTLFPKVKESDMNNIWFLQDSTTCHIVSVTIHQI